MCDHIVREAARSDLPGLLALYRELRPDDPELPFDEVSSSWDGLLGNSGVRVIVAESESSIASTCMAALIAEVALAANVKVTPLGGQDGEFCPQDRALIFEDPNGTRILYDAGRTVAGANDPRLGKIDIILVSHMDSQDTS